MREPPAGDELLECAARALRARVLPHVPDALRADVLMALRAMGIAARQLRADDAALRAECAALGQVLQAPCADVAEANRALAAAIRSGDADPGQPRRATLLHAVRGVVRRRLAESNPKVLQDGA